MKPNHVVIYLLVLFLSGCSAKYLTVVDEVLPARIPEVVAMRSLTLLDRTKESNIGVRIQEDDLFSQGNRQWLSACARRLPVTTTVYPKSKRASNAGAPARPLDRTDVREFGGQSVGLLALEQMFPRETRTYETYDKHQLDEQGNDYYIKVIRGTKHTELSTFWRLYDVQTGRVIVEIPYTVDEVVEAEARNQASVNAKLDTLYTTDFGELRSRSLELFMADVLPTGIESNWLYYTKGEGVLVRSGQLIEERRFYDAARLIAANTNQIPGMKKPEQAYLNWATALFLDGKIQEALSKADEGAKRYGGNELVNFIGKIQAYR